MDKVEGNIIALAETGQWDVVLQNCNCKNTMGRGVALDIAISWPEVANVDKATISGDWSKLGSFTKAEVTRNEHTFTVYNLYGQYGYGPASQRNFKLEAFEQALIKLKADLGGEPKRILFPLMGSGNGGGRWRTIAKQIEYHLGQHDLTLAYLPSTSHRGGI